MSRLHAFFSSMRLAATPAPAQYASRAPAQYGSREPRADDPQEAPLHAPDPAQDDAPVVRDHIRISVRPEYAASHSNPKAWRYVFIYHVTIENVGHEAAHLFWRHWRIHDLVAGDQEVEGEGVVGECPILEPGDVHRYNSFCVLRGPTGHMEGYYHFRRPDGSVFRAPIPRFMLSTITAPPEAVGTRLA